jgi:hypothetical protein
VWSGALVDAVASPTEGRGREGALGRTTMPGVGRRPDGVGGLAATGRGGGLALAGPPVARSAGFVSWPTVTVVPQLITSPFAAFPTCTPLDGLDGFVASLDGFGGFASLGVLGGFTPLGGFTSLGGLPGLSALADGLPSMIGGGCSLPGTGGSTLRGGAWRTADGNEAWRARNTLRLRRPPCCTVGRLPTFTAEADAEAEEAEVDADAWVAFDALTILGMRLERTFSSLRSMVSSALGLPSPPPLSEDCCNGDALGECGGGGGRLFSGGDLETAVAEKPPLRVRILISLLRRSRDELELRSATRTVGCPLTLPARVRVLTLGVDKVDAASIRGFRAGWEKKAL